ncbi:MAG: HDOD domain-containing protein [Sulfuricellaceae bacterium]
MTTPGILHKIGRFEVIDTLGKGAQSTVYLGYDPHLEREVAIKTVHFEERDELLRGLLIQEARTVSNLRHANIVPIFEAGEHLGDPYLIFEYVEGKTLAEMLSDDGALPVNRALDIIVQVLDAIDHAHRHGIIHRDLKPSNILINLDGVPRVMDFGIAIRVSGAREKDSELAGTPPYMAPEYISGKGVSPQSDIFAAGLILIEMITGKRVVQGNDVDRIFAQITAGTLLCADELGEFIDEKLGDIILRAIAHDPHDRYGAAQDMKEALQAYLEPGVDPAAGHSEESRKSTLEFLLRRMRHKSDFPALSESVSTINRIVASESENVTKLSNAVLRDFALANKVLKLVNSVIYYQFGGGAISTISRAVVILGFDAVRNIAVTLVLFEHLQNKPQAVHLMDDFIRTLFSGVQARVIAARKGYKEPEETFICAMFRNLGRLLAVFYFPEETDEISKRVLHQKCSYEIASAQVLGISYQDMGIGIARTWSFPEQIIHSMRLLPDGPVKKPETYQERLRILAEFCYNLCDLIADTPRNQKTEGLKNIATRFGSHMPLPAKDLVPAIDQALEEIVEYAKIIHVNLHQSKFGKQLLEWLRQSAAPVRINDDAETMVSESRLVADSGEIKKAGAASPQDAQDSPSILAAGIQDISNSLVENRPLTDVLRMILETMYRGMGFAHVLLCIKDGKQGAMNGRFGFGADIARIAKEFKFPLSYSADVFHAALSKGADILINDINGQKIRERIPEWYRNVGTAQTFVLFPLIIKNAPVALIYADKEFPGEIVFGEKELSLLRTLRNQALLAIKQSM